MRLSLSPSRAAQLAVVSDLSLAAIKLHVGEACASPILLADAKHSVMDAAVDLGVQTTLSAPPQMQRMLSAGIAIMILIVVLELVQTAASIPIATRARVKRGFTIVTAAQILALTIKTYLCRVLRAMAHLHPAESTVLLTASEHHRADVLVSGGALCGGLMSRIGFRSAERWTVIGIAFLLSQTAYGLVRLAITAQKK